MGGHEEGNTAKDENKTQSTQVNVKVSAQDGTQVHFKIKRHTPLRKLMQAYCDRQSIKMSSVRFMFDGNFITDAQTPDDIGIEDDEAIEVYLQQTGGSV